MCLKTTVKNKTYANMKILFYDLHKNISFLCKYENDLLFLSKN